MQAAAARLLVAVSPLSRPVVSAILAECEVDYVWTFEEGEAALSRQRYSHVIVGYYFAESRMFDFAQLVRRAQPEAKVLCIKGSGRPLEPRMRDGLAISVRALGCEGFVDLTAGEIPEEFQRLFNEVLARCRAAKSAV